MLYCVEIIIQREKSIGVSKQAELSVAFNKEIKSDI